MSIQINWKYIKNQNMDYNTKLFLEMNARALQYSRVINLYDLQYIPTIYKTLYNIRIEII